MSYSIPVFILVFLLTLAVLVLAYLLHKEKEAHSTTRAKYTQDRQRQRRRDQAVNFTNRIFNALNEFIKNEPLPLRIERENDIITVTRFGREIYQCFLRTEPKCVICVTINPSGCTYEKEATDDFITWVIAGAKESLKDSCVKTVA